MSNNTINNSITSSIYSELDKEDSTLTSITTWEQPILKSWENIPLDQVQDDISILNIQREKRLITSTNTLNNNNNIFIERRILRYFIIILDCSESILSSDIKPSRLLAILDILPTFLTQIYSQNPLCQIGMVTTHHDTAEMISPLTGSVEMMKTSINKWFESGSWEKRIGGTASFQASLNLSESMLKYLPSSRSREVLLISSALSTIDSSDISITINSLASNTIVCSVISMSSELHICRVLAHTTGGTMNVVTTTLSLRDYLFSFIPPSLIEKRGKQEVRTWLDLGFPTKLTDSLPVLCVCHNRLTYSTYQCPKCSSRYCDVPIDCKICIITLVSSPHLSRIFHYLYPVPTFEEIDFEVICFGCKNAIDSEKSLTLKCKVCSNAFCFDCDDYIHKILFNCPGCLLTN